MILITDEGDFTSFRGSGVDGMKGISETVIIGKLLLFRPLLSISREQLRNYLRSKNLDWREDPSNAHDRFDRVKEMKDVKTIVAPPISMGIFGYPHREGARITLEVLLKHLNGEEDPGFNEYIMVIKERNFISNMRTVYRESEDQLPGIDTTNE